MLTKHFYLLISLIYLSACDEPPYDPYLLYAYKQTKNSTPIKRLSSEDGIPELNNEWKEKLCLIHDPGITDLEDNIKQLILEDRDELWRIFNSIPPNQQPLFLKNFTTFNKDEQAALLDIIIYLGREDEELIEAALSGDIIYFPIDKQAKLLSMLQALKLNDQRLLLRLQAKLGN